MNRMKFLLSLECDCWRIYRGKTGEPDYISGAVTFNVTDGPLSVIQQLMKLLEEYGYRGQEICFGIDSSMVHSVAIDCDDLPRRQRQQMMLYRLEEQLPLEAEELTAAFLPARHGRCMALAVVSEKILGLVKGLSSVGIEVGPICPVALLSLWDCLKQCEKAPDYVIISHYGTMEIFRMVEGVPHEWYSSTDPHMLLNSLRISLLNCPAEKGHDAVLAGLMADDILAGFEREIPVTKIGVEEEFFDRTITQAVSLLFAGKTAGWIDFRTGKLARARVWKRAGGLLRSAAALAAILIIAMTASFVIRGMRYEKLAADYQRDRRDAYHTVYPGTKVPLNIAGRLEKELGRLAGVLGHGQDIPDTPKALDRLYDIIANIPPQLRIRILKMQIDDSNISIEGQVKTHSDASTFAQSLRKGGLDALEPKTERLASGDVSFVITATAPSAKTDVKKGARL